MRVLILFVSVLLLGLLAGCATLSKAQCQTGDWQSVGELDGRAGYPSTRIAEHNEACSKHGVTVDRALYNKGYQAGLKAYCTPNNAAKIGLAGRAYNNVCTGENGISFLRIYREANDVYTIDREIVAIQDEVVALTEKLADPNTTQAERDQIARQIRSLNSQLSLKFSTRAREDAELRQVLLEEQKRLSSL
ncbi:DUF2799 domain-containing protein [Maritalea porphyrae]|uniref:DUF2799 domain-containing protein n=1 Tax=Maritalea porphyrae TaxID=880732 RepID=A0ABQ5UPX5_9HYPH|nr:DUF2799 domain-containing protein [Maritalea porphyrae]GLQ17299.1 hypothetical protein GCM10007879_15480 [Maritalea porphyrae]